MKVRGIDVFTGEAVELTFKHGLVSRRETLEPGATPAGSSTSVGGSNPGAADNPGAANLPWLSPGWFDLQVNGWTRLDWNSDDLTLKQAEEMCLRLARTGTTRFLATVITAQQGEITRRLAAIRRFREDSAVVRRAVAGIHVEGPYISGEDGPRGAHDRAATRDPSVDELAEWVDASGGLVRIVTLAPERSGSPVFIERLREQGIVPALGHTNASAEQIHDAVRAGALCSTHLGNGIGVHVHRHLNPIWPQLANDGLTTCIIADTHHQPPDSLKTMIRAKGIDRIITVSDAAAPGGSGPGVYEWSGIHVEVNEDGGLRLAGTPYLAGAGHLLDRGVRTLVAGLGMPIADAAKTVTTNPFRLLGIPDEEWDLRPGSRADIVCFRPDGAGDLATIESVHVEGEAL